MAKVSLIEYTGKGRSDEQWHAANLLIFTKSTRLEMDGALFNAVQEQPERMKLDELEYMAKTIPSSWEFIDVTFLISGVSRACAQQMTRTRNASYAMQSQRVADISKAGYVVPDGPLAPAIAESCEVSLLDYQRIVDRGASREDARSVLPMCIECNLVAKYNLRSFVELMRARQSLRVQGEYSDIADQMRLAVIEAWPWSETFFEAPLAKAINMLEQAAEQVGVDVGSGPGWEIAKAIDLLRKV